MHVCVIGTGYVGLVTAACLSHIGHTVVGVDVDRRKIARLREGLSPIYEPGLERLLRVQMDVGGLAFSEDAESAIAKADAILIAVGTPPRVDGHVDLRHIEAVLQTLKRALERVADRATRLIVSKSTVPVGTARWMAEWFRTSSFTGQVLVVSNPEFLREGNALHDCLYPDRIIVGAEDARAVPLVRQLYRPILEQTFPTPDYIPPRPEGLRRVPLLWMDWNSAEMAKYASNAFLALKISFANEIANICERVGADVARVMEAVGLDHRIGPHYLRAGIGWGGSCLGKDLMALIRSAEQVGYDPALLRAVQTTNAYQRRVVIEKLRAVLGSLKGRTIGLLGLAFKPNTDDIRDAPSMTIARVLQDEGARVKVYDPVAMENAKAEHPDLALSYATDPIDLARECDALVLVTEWEEFRQLDLAALRRVMRGDVLLDGRNLFDPERARRAGFTYLGMGRALSIARAHSE
ncbi:MAG: UDP-glucose/GDP-mannose dehydrogenase family protein [Blastocatellia bacterium]|nr:UDP-glucose/GDP-mannose dehydrogenase family protein [Blastocatellia bacterium]MCS7157625.1 UDP-glucose/GDP-mannose dehydrogenase family protein [Blastocatellia bacterium]MDW8257100.1 UDP-glucose/GDP-mannose dehydrogenase family protein [Acidobacteriota bacterium]